MMGKKVLLTDQDQQWCKKGCSMITRERFERSSGGLSPDGVCVSFGPETRSSNGLQLINATYR
jgi:hypothetical protein